MFELIIVLALILLNGFFAMSEMSVMTSRKSRLKQMAGTSKRAARALELSEKPESFLSTVQIGITLIGILTGVFGGEAIGLAIAEWLHSVFPAFAYASEVGKALAVALITFLTLIFGELVPKRLAITRSEDIAGLVAWPMGWLSRIAFPAVWLLSHSTRLVLRVLGLGKDEAASVTEEEIRMVIELKAMQWANDAKMRDFLKPETLTRPIHFPKYLEECYNAKNQQSTPRPAVGGFAARDNNRQLPPNDQRKMDMILAQIAAHPGIDKHIPQQLFFPQYLASISEHEVQNQLRNARNLWRPPNFFSKTDEPPF